MNEKFAREFFGMPAGAPPIVTKRELFAALNYQGLCANSKEYLSAAHMARLAVNGADALLAELSKAPEGPEAVRNV